MFTPGAIWHDIDGKPIQAHGGGVLQHNGVYYWFGENKDGNTIEREPTGYQLEAPIGVSCYTSTDLYTWHNRGVVLSADAVPGHTSAITVIERPKVIYNPRTDQFVMWFHHDNGDYSLANVGVATSKTPHGPYQFVHSFRPCGYESRDMTVFVDDDGAGYVLFSSFGNSTMIIARLADNFLDTTAESVQVFVNRYREAPAVFKHDGRYYMVTSGCTGWDPNETLYAVADTLTGTWRSMGNPCEGPRADITFGAQGTYILPVVGRPGTYIFMADRWRKEDLADSRYVWLPVQINGDQLTIPWRDAWHLDDATPPAS